MRQKINYDKKRAGNPYQVGDSVWLYDKGRRKGRSPSIPKLSCKWHGPYLIISTISHVVYRIQKRFRKLKWFTQIALNLTFVELDFRWTGRPWSWVAGRKRRQAKEGKKGCGEPTAWRQRTGGWGRWGNIGWTQGEEKGNIDWAQTQQIGNMDSTQREEKGNIDWTEGNEIRLRKFDSSRAHNDWKQTPRCCENWTRDNEMIGKHPRRTRLQPQRYGFGSD